jgi:hypothetical protein
VGGDAGSYRLTPRRIERLARATQHLAESDGGSILWTTSARTPTLAPALLTSLITVPTFGYTWPSRDDNPYDAYLALADAFVVTGESISMLTEAASTTKPVHIFAPGTHPVPLPGPADPPTYLRPETYTLKSLATRLAALGPRRMRRDVSIIHHRLIASHRAVWLGTPFPTHGLPPSPSPDLERAVDRVRALFG